MQVVENKNLKIYFHLSNILGAKRRLHISQRSLDNQRACGFFFLRLGPVDYSMLQNNVSAAVGKVKHYNFFLFNLY